MAAEKETAFVLPADAVTGSDEPVHIGGYPGVWTPGEPIAVSELDFPTLKDAREAKDEVADVLKETKVEVGSAPMPERVNHLANTAEAGQSEVVAAHAEVEVLPDAEAIAAATGATTPEGEHGGG